MRILIISQNSYPMQGPRAFRTQELSEELVRVGHDVTVYSVHGDVDYTEYTQKTGVKMRDIQTRLPLSANDDKNRFNLLGRFMFHYFHRLLLFPEVELHFSIDSILQKEKDVDLLITIAYPHTIHSGAARSKRKHPHTFPKVWIADCGDPFFLNPFVNAPKYMEKYEREWCEAVNYITVPTSASIGGYFPEYRDKIRVIPQGFDFSKTPVDKYTKNETPTFVFCGMVYPGKRDVSSFMEYLLKLNKPYKFKLLMRYPLEERFETESNHQIEYIIGKTRKEVILECSKADFLINVKNPNPTQTPSKLIDYGISGRPVLEISNDFCEQEQFEEFYHGDYHSRRILPDIDQFRIENVTNQFVQLANTILKQ